MDIWDPHYPFIDIDRGSCYNQTGADLVSKMVAKANFSWEDFLPALQLTYNTSYQSMLATSPFELLYGYKPTLPKSNLEPSVVPVTFAKERKQTNIPIRICLLLFAVGDPSVFR